MGKRGGRGGRSSLGASNLSNGGVAGSGIFGMVGTTIRCDANDTSMYCNIMKFFNLLLVVFGVLVILYVIYNLVSMYTRKGK
jgi:hypothetical protein